MDAGSLFSSAPTMVGTPLAWVLPMTSKMPFPIEGLEDSAGGGKKTVRWSLYMEELDTANSLSYELMTTQNGSLGKQDACASTVRNMVLDGAGNSYVVPAILSYVTSNGEKNESEPWDSDMYLYATIIPRMCGTAMSYALWYKKMNGHCSCQQCKGWCRY